MQINVTNHIPYLWGLSNAFSNSFIDFYSCDFKATFSNPPPLFPYIWCQIPQPSNNYWYKIPASPDKSTAQMSRVYLRGMVMSLFDQICFYQCIISNRNSWDYVRLEREGLQDYSFITFLLGLIFLGLQISLDNDMQMHFKWQNSDSQCLFLLARFVSTTT